MDWNEIRMDLLLRIFTFSSGIRFLLGVLTNSHYRDLSWFCFLTLSQSTISICFLVEIPTLNDFGFLKESLGFRWADASKDLRRGDLDRCYQVLRVSEI